MRNFINAYIMNDAYTIFAYVIYYHNCLHAYNYWLLSEEQTSIITTTMKTQISLTKCFRYNYYQINKNMHIKAVNYLENEDEADVILHN